MVHLICLTAALAALLAVTAQRSPPPPPSPAALPLGSIRLPAGFEIQLYTTLAVPGARQLALSQGKNTKYPKAVIVYVGTIIEPGSVSGPTIALTGPGLSQIFKFTLHEAGSYTIIPGRTNKPIFSLKFI